MDDLEIIRKQIDAIDDQLFALLEERFSLSENVKKIKKQSSISIVDQSREKMILNRIPNTLHHTEITALYDTIFTLSKAIQQKGSL